ncbi:MAG: hypothetical protein GY906_17085 [bacterium]|nr:hypothetical protein [bacterium]
MPGICERWSCRMGIEHRRSFDQWKPIAMMIGIYSDVAVFGIRQETADLVEVAHKGCCNHLIITSKCWKTKLVDGRTRGQRTSSQ